MVADLADVIRSKEAADREKDRAVLPILRQVLERSRLNYEREKGQNLIKTMITRAVKRHLRYKTSYVSCIFTELISRYAAAIDAVPCC